MPRGKAVSYKTVKAMVKAHETGMNFAQIGRRFKLDQTTASAHIRAYQDGSWTSQTVAQEAGPRPVLHASKKVKKGYSSTSPVDKNSDLLRSQAKAAMRDNEGLRHICGELSADNVKLKLYVFKLLKKLESMKQYTEE